MQLTKSEVLELICETINDNVETDVSNVEDGQVAVSDTDFQGKGEAQTLVLTCEKKVVVTRKWKAEVTITALPDEE